MALTPAQGRQDVSMLAGFLASYVLRGATSAVDRWFRKHCFACACGFGSNSGAVLAGERGLSWRDARSRLAGVKDGPLMAAAALRLVLWHFLQPAAFCLVLFSWSDKLTSELQRGLAFAVLARELLYLLCTLAALYLCPAFLLIDLVATWKAGNCGEVIVYVLMPEKFLGWYISGLDTSLKARFNAYFMLVLVLDACGLVGLYLGVSGAAELPVPLAVCYCVTAVSLLAMPCWALALLLLQQLGVGLQGPAAPAVTPLTCSNE